MSDRLAGKVCIITGTGGSVGRASALRFAGESALVVGCDVNVAAGEETQAAGSGLGVLTRPHTGPRAGLLALACQALYPECRLILADSAESGPGIQRPAETSIQSILELV
jgi:NAD(P)-dependent dehydrogenase (short-subunit alcohol dehydrogenase family)